MRRVYVTGGNGLLGTALRAALAADPVAAGWECHHVSIEDFDIGDRPATVDSIMRVRPHVVVHTAANAVVDECERDLGLALRVNIAGVRNVVDACHTTGARLLLMSSDYVFDGDQPPTGGYRENDLPNPLSVYGLTKVAGERIAATLPDHLVVRTSWLFGGSDERVDDVLALIRLAQRGQAPRLIADQHSRPTYTHDLAAALVFLLDHPITGTVHAANAGTASWYDVGRFLLDSGGPLGAALPTGVRPEPVAMAERGFLGGRPRNSTLNTDRLTGLGHRMPSWQDGVRRFCDILRTAAAGR